MTDFAPDSTRARNEHEANLYQGTLHIIELFENIVPNMAGMAREGRQALELGVPVEQVAQLIVAMRDRVRDELAATAEPVDMDE